MSLFFYLTSDFATFEDLPVDPSLTIDLDTIHSITAVHDIIFFNTVKLLTLNPYLQHLIPSPVENLSTFL